jgi:type IV pilus assembly protein PilB
MMKLALENYTLDESNLDFSVTGLIIDIGDTTITKHNNMDVTRYLNRTLIKAINLGASDLHFEPYAGVFRIRFRVDGIMQNVDVMPKGFGHLLTARLKVIAGLDIAEQRVTQSGRFKLILSAKDALDFRCSSTPTMHGETFVLRILHLPETLLDLDHLGLTSAQAIPIQDALNRQQGMILITGPTGSGKTVTLYTLLKLLNEKNRSIYTVEDPVEIDLSGVNQVSVADRLTFADAARSLLRQDPDVIMLGEIRDEETIDTAIKAAHTGHLVLSTLHANTAPKVIPRLRNLGVPAYDISSTVTLVISQRLLRKLDPDNRELIAVPKERLLALGFKPEELDKLQLYRAKPNVEASNPDTPHKTGYKGRVGIFQIMPITTALAVLIAKGATDAHIEKHIQAQGINDLRRSALDKVKAGITDIDEVERVLGVLEDAELEKIEQIEQTKEQDNDQ